MPLDREVDRTFVRTIDFNRILGALNVTIFVSILVAYWQKGSNAYVNGETVMLAAMLALQIQVALFIERRRRDPFIILLAFVLVLYYSLRILTLLVFSFSFVLDRFAYAPVNSNFALLFIILANLFLYAGLYFAGSVRSDCVQVGSWRARAPMRSLALVAIAIAFIYGRGVLGDEASLPRALQFLTTFLAQNFIMVMGLTYFIVFGKTLSRRFALALFALLVFEMVLHSLSGSRSAFVVALQSVLVVMLAVKGVVAIRRKLVLVGLALAPAIVLFLVVSFTISTYVREVVGREKATLGDLLLVSQAAGERLTLEYAFERGLSVLLARSGYFDYSADVIANRRKYQRVINAPAYGRSVVDNILTPGFDVFDQPKISSSLRFVYQDEGRPSKMLSAEGYQSDQLGIFGELFVLFGFASLPLFFLGGFLFKRVYRALNDPDPFLRAIKRVVTLLVFVVMLNSFGLDWWLFDLIPLVVSVYLYRYFFAAERVELAAAASAYA